LTVAPTTSAESAEVLQIPQDRPGELWPQSIGQFRHEQIWIESGSIRLTGPRVRCVEYAVSSVYPISRGDRRQPSRVTSIHDQLPPIDLTSASASVT